jgi:hypothetical protein
MCNWQSSEQTIGKEWAGLLASRIGILTALRVVRRLSGGA